MRATGAALSGTRRTRVGAVAVTLCGALLQGCATEEPDELDPALYAGRSCYPLDSVAGRLKRYGAVRAYSLRNEMRTAMMGVDSTSALRVMAVMRSAIDGKRFQTQAMFATFGDDGRMLEAFDTETDGDLSARTMDLRGKPLSTDARKRMATLAAALMRKCIR